MTALEQGREDQAVGAALRAIVDEELDSNLRSLRIRRTGSGASTRWLVEVEGLVRTDKRIDGASLRSALEAMAGTA